MALTQEEVLRYSRHLIMPEVGVDGQEKLKNASVLIIGCGGLGSPLSIYLAAAGIGHIGLVDVDLADFSNLQRQIAFGTQDVGRPKVEATKDRILSINPNLKVTTYRAKLNAENVMDIFKPFDIIIDGTDNFPTRYLTNDACVFLKKPNVYGSIFRFEGQATIFWGEKGPCYRCLYPEPPPPGMVPSCAEGGVLGILPGTIGLIQATEAVKLILGKGDPLVGRLLLYNALDMKFREVKLQKDPECPVCSANPSITKLIDYEQFCGIGLGQEEATLDTNGVAEITARELKAKIDRKDSFVLVDVREPHEYQIAKIPGARLIPLGEVMQRARELDTADDIVVHCRSGARSAKAIQGLQKLGFKRLKNLKGGILAWSQDVDPSVPQY
jgi:sulfur-carrier protein adenylyltransferase/sulfurtransferase